MPILEELQQLTPSQSALLHRLVDLGYLTRAQVDQLINRLVSDRFAKARAYLTFAQALDVHLTENQPHIISRGYYAMYHAARALILHVRRNDVDNHNRLPTFLGQVLGTDYENLLVQWRRRRNMIDYSPYAPTDLANQATTVLVDADLLLTASGDYLRNRGVSL